LSTAAVVGRQDRYRDRHASERLAMSGSSTDGMAAWLRKLPETELAALLERRTDVLHRPLASFDDLASRLSQPQGIGVALRLVDRTAVQVAAVLALLGGRATPQQLTDAVSRTEPVGQDLVEAALARLAGAGLAWPASGGDWRSAGGLAHSAEALLGFGPPLRSALTGAPLLMLREAMGALGLGGARSTYDALNAIAGVFERPGSLRALLDDAPPEVWPLLEHLAGAGHDSPADGSSAEDWLADRLLVLIDHLGGRTLPREVSVLMRGDRLVGVVRREPEEPTAPAPAPASAAELALGLVEDMRTLLDACQAAPVKALQSGGVGVKEQRRLAKGMNLQTEYVAWLLDLAGEAGLLGTMGSAGLVTGGAADWRGLEEPAAHVALVRAVLDSPAGPRPHHGEQPAPLAGWRFADHDLLPLPLVLAGATRHSAAVAEDDERLAAWLDWRHYRPGSAERRRLLLLMQLDQLRLLGLRADGGCAPWAAALRDGSDDEAAAQLAKALPPAQDDAVFQADGTAFVGGRATVGLRALLDAVAGREGERTWRVTAAGVRQVLDDGRHADDLLEELRARSVHRLPQVVEQLVRDVAAKHGRIRVLPANTLLRIDDVPLAVEVLRDKRLKALALSEVLPGVLSSPKPAKDVLAALRSAGHAPVGEAGAARPGRTPKRAVARTRPPRPSVGPLAAEAAARLRAAPRHLAVVPEPAVRKAAVPAATHPLARRLTHLPAGDVVLLVDAVEEGGAVEIDYVASSGRQTTRTIIDPEDTGRLLVAWCELRDDERNFEPARILAVRAMPDY
jgi:hypothetical protein